MSKLRDKILAVIAEEKPEPAHCVATPVSVGALYAARLNVTEDDFVRMCRRALAGARDVWRNHDLDERANVTSQQTRGPK